MKKKKMIISQGTMDVDFVRKVEALSGTSVRRCFQCGKCSAGCPMATFMEHPPNRVVRLLQLGQWQRILAGRSIWYCASCETCTTRCPNKVDLGYIITSIEKMDVLLNGLLRLSRLGRAAICFEQLDMQMIVSKIIESLTFQIESANARVEVGALAGCLADAGQMSQVFSNLIENSIKYRSKDRALIVTVSSEEFVEGVRYCVEDNGIGIPSDQQDKIWEIFNRLDPTGTTGEGLGLTMARRIIDRLGGSIWVESELDVGSRFYVVMPKQQGLSV